MAAKSTCSQAKCSKLIEAIDFFSQIIHVDQLSLYGHNFLANLFRTNRSAVYTLNQKNGNYRLIDYLGDPPPAMQFPATLDFEEIATKLGRVMYKDFDRYFPESFLNEYPITMLMPIITKDRLFGFVLADTDLDTCGFDQDFAEAIKNLVCNAYFVSKERADSLAQQESMNRKLYDFLLMQQSSRLLMGELDLDSLCQMCVDAVRELTASSCTGFALHDPRLNKLVVRCFSDILHFQKIYAELSWQGPEAPEKIFYDVEDDFSLLKEYFDKPEVFSRMHATHIILLVKNKVEGFITIGEPVSGVPHQENTMELATSIASTILVAIENARYVQHIRQQHQLLQDSYHALETMRSIIRTLTSSESLSELGEIVLQTIAMRCQMTRGCLCIWDNARQGYQILSACGQVEQEALLLPTKEGKNLLQRGLIYDTIPGSITRYLTAKPKLPFSDKTLIAPVALEILNEEHQGLVGMIICDEFTQHLENKELTFLESMGGCIAPFINHMLALAEVEAELKLSCYEKFSRSIDIFLADQQRFGMDFAVYYKRDIGSPFAPFDSTPYQGLRWHRLGKLLAVIAYTEEDIPGEIFDGHICGDKAAILCQIESLL